MPRVVDASEPSIVLAAAALRAGGVVAFPTETVYGLGARTLDEAAIRRVYELKGRPLDNPLIAHVPDAEAARTVASWDDRAERLAAAHWPGPLALVLPRRDEVPAIATGGRDTIAVRVPDHPAALALLRAVGGAVSAPSANRSGRVSPTTAAHVAEEFRDAADLLVIDGGPCRVGVESTVLDLSSAVPRVLRPGGVSAAAIEAVIGRVDAPRIMSQDASPGTRSAHYAPEAPVRLVDRAALAMSIAATPGIVAVLAPAGTPVPPPHVLVEMPTDAAAYARRLYAALREADAARPATILVERPPHEGPLWVAVHDRLGRAGG